MKPFWKPARKSRDLFAHINIGQVALSAITPVGPRPTVAAAGPVTLSAINPFVSQLLSHAATLEAVSRSVEHMVGREGITTLAATRDHVDPGSLPYSPSMSFTPASYSDDDDDAPAYKPASALARSMSQGIGRPHLVVSQPKEPIKMLVREEPQPLIRGEEFADLEEDDAPRRAPLTDAMAKLTSHYVRRFFSTSAADAPEAITPLGALTAQTSVSVGLPTPGAMGSSILAFSHDSVEIPKVPPYVWPAPLAVSVETEDQFSSYFNCQGNRFQLALDLEASRAAAAY